MLISVGMYTSLRLLREIQQALTALQDQGLGKAKSAALDSLREHLVRALRLGFTRHEIWQALGEVGYEGSYRYFATKLHHLGITRSSATSPAASFPAGIALGRAGGSDVSTAVAEPVSLDPVEAQRRRLEEARRRGDIYRNPKPEPKKIFVFNREED